MEKVQRKGARCVTGRYSHRDSVTSMLDTLHWPPLQFRRQNKRLTTFYKAIHGHSPIDIPDYVVAPVRRYTRAHDKAFIELQANTDQYRNSFLPRTIRDWNALPSDLVMAGSADDFINQLQKTH